MTTFAQTDETQNQPTTTAQETPKESQQQEQPTDQQRPTDHSQSAFLIVGDRAYNDAGSVITKITNADNHIATLEGERRTDRQKISDLEEQLGNQKKINEAFQAKLDNNNSGNGTQTETLSKDELVKEAAKLANQMNAAEQTEQQRENNIRTAMAQAKEVFGDGYLQKVNEIAGQNGMSVEAVDALAKSSPKGFAKLFFPADSQNEQRTAQPTGGSINTEGFGNQPEQHKPVNATKMTSKERAAYVAKRLAEMDNE